MPLFPAQPWINGSGFPKSGTAGTGVGSPAGTIYRDSNTGVMFANEGTAAAPYWTVTTPRHPRVLSYLWNGAMADDITLADTSQSFRRASAEVLGYGQGIEVNDSGAALALPAAVLASGWGYTYNLTTTDEDAHLMAIAAVAGTGNAIWQPDQHGTMVLDTIITNQDDILLRANFVGWVGNVVSGGAQNPIVTGSGTTITFATTEADDVAGFFFDVGLDDVDRWFFPYDKRNTNASIATTASQVDTGVNVAAAGTFQRLRVEIDSDGAIRGFINKTQVVTLAAGTLDADEELVPVVYIENVDAGAPAVQILQVARFHAYGLRPTLP